MLPGAFIDGSNSATFVLNTIGDVVLQKLDFSGDSGGIVEIYAGGSVLIQRPFTAKSMSDSGSGGELFISAGGDLVAAGGSVIDLRAGTGILDSIYGGANARFSAAGKVDLGDFLDVRGEGSNVEIGAGTDIILRGVRGDSPNPDEDAGQVFLTAGRDVQILGSISMLGASSADGQSNAGSVDIAAVGNLSIQAPIWLDGGLPEGSGGVFTASVGRTISVAAQGTISALNRGGTEPDGGVGLYAGSTITLAGWIDTTGYVDASPILIDAVGDVTVNASLDVRAFSLGPGFAEPVASLIAVTSNGLVLITAPMYAGPAGKIELEGCDVTVAGTGFVTTSGTYGGEIDITTLGQLHIDGVVTARGYGADRNGMIALEFAASRPPLFGSRSVVRPAPETIAVADGDLRPCPKCGNGVQERNEECDDGNRTDCDACDSNCTRANTCGNNPSCGAVPCDAASTATPTAIATPTPTVTAAASATATVTPTLTLFETATLLPTPTTTPTPTPSPPLIDCAGDCDASGEVTIDELARGVGIALGTGLLNACPVFDMDGNAEITIDELLQGVNNALNGCPPPGH